MNIIQKLLSQRGVLLADGATGSNLFKVGLQNGACPELWNATNPECITAQYQSFVDAGSDIILTNTFGATSLRLSSHDLADRAAELNIKGAQLARACVDATQREIIIGGSIGPSGGILKPLGDMEFDDAVAAFAVQATALKAGGADVLWIETMSSQEEVQAAVSGAATAGLPIVVTFSVDTNGRTMMGLAPANIVELSQKLSTPPEAIGSNCGVGAGELVAATLNMKRACDARGLETIIVAKANCGIPQYLDGEIVYSGDQAIMSAYARLAMDAGAQIIGGCCGTTPSHIKAMRESIDTHEIKSPPTLEDIELKLGEISTGAKAQLRGEMSIAAGAISGARARRQRAR